MSQSAQPMRKRILQAFREQEVIDIAIGGGWGNYFPRSRILKVEKKTVKVMHHSKDEKIVTSLVSDILISKITCITTPVQVYDFSKDPKTAEDYHELEAI
jgi:hypothetical protein